MEDSADDKKVESNMAEARSQDDEDEEQVCRLVKLQLKMVICLSLQIFWC